MIEVKLEKPRKPQPATLKPMTASPTLEDLQHGMQGAAEHAIQELLGLGIPVFYTENNTDILEQTNGQRFQIEYTGLTRGAYRVVCELPRAA